MRKKSEKIFESLIWNFRFIILIPVIILLLASLVAFYLGTKSFINAFLGITQGHTENIIVYLISSLDEFLLGIVLIILSLGIYELFISKIDAISSSKLSPKWLEFSSMEELKTVLSKVLIIILMVFFFKHVVFMDISSALDSLFLAGGILLLAVAQYLSHKK